MVMDVEEEVVVEEEAVAVNEAVRIYFRVCSLYTELSLLPWRRAIRF